MSRLKSKYNIYANMTRKESRAMQELRSEVGRERNSVTCPYCGAKMIYTSSEKVHSKYDSMMYVCSRYPACDTYCRTITTNGKIKMVSTPANKELRNLRNAVHHYMQALLDNHIYETKDDIYFAINKDFTISTGKRIHIGECREYSCKQAIGSLVRILYANKNRIKKIRQWTGIELDEETQKMLDEISYVDRRYQK